MAGSPPLGVPSGPSGLGTSVDALASASRFDPRVGCKRRSRRFCLVLGVSRDRKVGGLELFINLHEGVVAAVMPRPAHAPTGFGLVCAW